MDSSLVSNNDVASGFVKESMVDPFLVEALQNPRHRLTILRMELDIQKFMNNADQQHFEFQHFPSSYLRLAAHRVAQHYGMQTMVQDIGLDGQSKILVRKLPESKYPVVRLSEIPAKQLDNEKSELKKIVIQSRPHKTSLNGANDSSKKGNPLRSVEERKEEYDRARARIFNGSTSFDSVDTSSMVPTDGKNSFMSKDESETSKIPMADSERFFGVRDNSYPRVAIIRDREKDRSDPDYDRSYGRYARSLSASAVNLVPFNLPKAQPSFAPYETTFNQLGQMPQAQASLGYGPPSTPMMSPFCTPGLNPASGDGAYLQWPSPTMMYAHSYDQFRHAVYQEINMESFGNSNPLISQESAHQQAPGMEGSSNPSHNALTPPNEIVETPNGESAANMDTGDNIAALAETENSRLRSEAWKHFTRMKVNGEDKAQCKYCKKFLGGKSRNGTKHLLQHKDRCLHRKIHDNKTNKGQTFLMPKGKQEIGVGSYNAENSKKELACAIIMHEYPLSIVDHIGFRRFAASLQPMFQVPCRNTIKKEIFKVYEFEMSKTSKLLDNLQSRVAITSDMWTSSNQKKGYMAVTVHYIDGSWKLQSRILRFIYVPAPHSSDRLCAALVQCLMEWNIDTKVSTITLDNCSTNDAMVDKIKEKLNLNTLLRDGSLLHMRCVAHILNLIVKDGLEVVKDGIERIRDSVAYWTATPKRKERFEKTARQLRISCTKNLSLDCPTRWNSTYKMLDIAILYEDVFSRLKLCDPQYTCVPTSSQWKFAKDVCERLKLFNGITELISGTKYPTANMFFPEICKIKLAISDWIDSSNKLIEEMAKKMLQKFDKYWSVTHDIMGVATVLDPRYKMDLLEYYYEKLYEQDSVEQVGRIRQLCYELIADYQLKFNQDTCGDSSMLEASRVANDGLDDYDAYVQKKKRAKTSLVRTELDHYLEEEVLPRSPDFDILLWWKLNGIKYPTLQAIAKDILAIPISTVASESAFSTSGHILSPHRSRLHWTTLEALMCARSWLWSTENSGGRSSKLSNDYASLLDEIEPEDEGEILASGVTSLFEDGQ